MRYEFRRGRQQRLAETIRRVGCEQTPPAMYDDLRIALPVGRAREEDPALLLALAEDSETAEAGRLEHSPHLPVQILDRFRSPCP
jgi:hypothetical protein